MVQAYSQSMGKFVDKLFSLGHVDPNGTSDLWIRCDLPHPE